MLHAIWGTLRSLLALLGQGLDPRDLLTEETDRGHEMDPNG
jgi:hypothetical protein